MSSVLSRLENGTIELTLTVLWPDLQKAYEEAVTEAVEAAEIKGFRKGKAPRNLVEEKLNRNDTLSHAIQHLLPKVYAEAVKEHALKPILYPQIKIEKGTEGEDWVFKATTCEAPVAKLPNYKTMFTKDQKLDQKLDLLLKDTQVVIPDLLVQEEANHRLSSLVENLTQLGMTTDQYLASKKLTVEQLRAQIAQEAKTSLNLEFALMEIQKQEKLADRQKTLDFLTSLV